MPSTSSILSKLKTDFSDIHFIKGDIFQWRPAERAVYYENITDTVSLLHEVAHAALNHRGYTRDVELLEIEREAWDKVISDLSKRYDVMIHEHEVENMLDTYRDWLHDRSLCPTCDATGVQTDRSHYSCLACLSNWRVNEARNCALRRYTMK